MTIFRRSEANITPTISTIGPSPFDTAGVAVTSRSARQKIAYQSAVNLLAGMASTLPIGVYRRTRGTIDPRPAPAVVLDPEGAGYGWSDFAYKFVSQLTTTGNLFVVPGPLKGARPTTVSIAASNNTMTRKVGDEWWVQVGTNPARPLYGAAHLDGIKHVRAYPLAGQLLGDSPIANHARSLGVALAAEQFGADFFAAGGHPSGILTTDAKIDEAGARTIKDRFVAAIRGSREPAVLGGGVEYQQVQIGPAESQFLEVQKFSSAEICRIFGPGIAEMLGYETGGTMTYTNVQSRSLHLLIYTLNPWLVRLEQFVSDYLLEPDEYAQIDRKALLQMTATDRWNVTKTRLMTGATTINRVLAEEGELPVEWGDEPYLPSFLSAAAMVTQQAEVV